MPRPKLSIAKEKKKKRKKRKKKKKRTSRRARDGYERFPEAEAEKL
jgi:hypothetical protein